ncbi:MAG: hypothetical protein K8T91_09180 [Planctomycetes bacterium]|nr:hypothetical protein [Planctomycetota bacterium]
MSTLDQKPDDLSPQRNLPPVQPPTAGFIVQLFVIPALVVLVIVLVWLLFNWLAHMGGNPASYVKAMKANRANSWQQAYNLAEELQQNETARNDPELAKEVAAFLDELLAQPLPPAKDPVRHERDPRSEEVQRRGFLWRRGFLCQALGQFRTPQQTLPVLLKAAAPHKDEDELRIRVAALQALALLAENMRATRPINDPRVMQSLIRASTDEAPVVADAGTFGLGVLGGPEAVKRLKQILREARPADVHYNAALALARHGDSAGLDLISEMIDPATKRSLTEESEKARSAKQARLQLNGLRAAHQLAAANPKADLASLIPVIQKVQASAAPGVVKSEAGVVLRELQARTEEKQP